VGVRNDEQVAADVGIQIEDYIVMRAPAEDKLAFVIFGILVEVAKDAGRRSRLFTARCIEIFVAPGTP
jgi:hypothetical protein